MGLALPKFSSCTAFQEHCSGAEWGRSEEGRSWLRLLLGAQRELMMECRGLAVLELNSVWSEFAFQKWPRPLRDAGTETSVRQEGYTKGKDGLIIRVSNPCLQLVAKWKMTSLFLSPFAPADCCSEPTLAVCQSWPEDKDDLSSDGQHQVCLCWEMVSKVSSSASESSALAPLLTSLGWSALTLSQSVAACPTWPGKAFCKWFFFFFQLPFYGS